MVSNFCRRILKTIKNIPFQIIVLTLALILFLLIPILFILLLPLLLSRYLTHKSARWLNPKLGKMVTVRGHVSATDTKYKIPKGNVTVQLTLEGRIEIDKLREIVVKNLIKGRFPNGEFKYPELTQHLTRWGGYYFWEEDENFDIRDRIYDYSTHKGENFAKNFTLNLDDQDIQGICQALLNKPWIKKQPLWEIIVVQNYHPKWAVNYEGPHSVMFIRYHHTLADGYSILPLITEGIAEQEKFKNARPYEIPRGSCETILRGIGLPFKGSYESAKLILHALFFEMPFKAKESVHAGMVNVGISDQISVKKIKEIKSHFKVSFSSVIFAIAAGALRDIMIKKRIHVPKKLRTFTVLPLSGHGQKLRNYFTLGIITLPTGESDPLSRLQYCFKNYLTLKDSSIPWSSAYITPLLIGSYWAPIVRKMGQNFLTTCGLTNFPAPPNQMDWLGMKCSDGLFCTGIQSGSQGIGISSLSYMDNLRISLAGEISIMTKEDVSEMPNLIVKHFEMLYDKVLQDAV